MRHAPMFPLRLLSCGTRPFRQPQGSTLLAVPRAAEYVGVGVQETGCDTIKKLGCQVHQVSPARPIQQELACNAELVACFNLRRPRRGAVGALVAFCLVRRRHGRARKVMTDVSAELTFRICRSVLAVAPRLPPKGPRDVPSTPRWARRRAAVSAGPC